MMERVIPFLGILLWCLIAASLSSHRKSIPYGLVVKGLILQLILTLCVLGIPFWGISGPLKFVFDWSNSALVAVLNMSMEGAKFIFGSMVDTKQFGFIFAFQVLPTIIFMSSLMSLLYHWGVMQKVVNGFAWLMKKTLKTSGAETLSTAANIFVGQTEAPLMIKPYLNSMTRSEIFCVMVGGMASVAGGVLAAYVGMLNESIPGIAGHLMIASILSAPATLIISKIMLPEMEKPETDDYLPKSDGKKIHANSLDAAAQGASEGLGLALNVAAMLIAFISLVALFNGALAWGSVQLGFGETQLSFQKIVGWVFAPFSFFLGIPWEECLTAGRLLGEKTVLNEFVAYSSLAEISPQISERTRIILSYALCGFANFSSIAIQIGGIGSIAPSQKRRLAELGVKSVIGGTLCSFIIAGTVALLI